MTDTIKAGQYELVASRFDQPTSKPNEPFEFKRHTRGDLVTLNAEDAERLLKAGAVVKPGELQRQAAAAARLAYEAALAALPDEVRAEMLANQQTAEDGQQEQGGGEPVAKPKRSAAKELWVAYAVDQGMDLAAAEALTAQQLAAQYPDS